MSLLTANYGAISSAVYVGQSIKLVIEHPDMFSLKGCTAYSYDTTGSTPADGGSSVVFVDTW